MPGDTEMAEVAIVGYGPVGATLAALLFPFLDGVAVFERSSDVFPLPRAAHFDHEVMRVFQAAGVDRDVLSATTPVRGTARTLDDLPALVEELRAKLS